MLFSNRYDRVCFVEKNRVFGCEDIFKPSLKYRDVKILFLKDFIITVLNSLSENKLI